MSNFFKQFVETISGLGELTDAHLYHYDYISATVRGNDGKTYEFTVSIKEDNEND